METASQPRGVKKTSHVDWKTRKVPMEEKRIAKEVSEIELLTVLNNATAKSKQYQGRIELSDFLKILRRKGFVIVRILKI